MKNFILTGRVVSKTNNSGIAGLSVQAVLQGQKRKLATTLTNEEGGFHFIFQENKLGENAKIQVVVYSMDKKEVAKAKKTVQVKFTTQAEVEIVADDELIREHLSKTISLKPVEGRIFPVEKLDHMYSAINLYGNTKYKYSFGDDRQPGITCHFPEFTNYDHILIDGYETLQGDPYASQRFQNTLDTVAFSMEKRRGRKTRIDFNGAKWKSYIKEKRLNHDHDGVDHDPMVPLEKSALLMMAAKYIAGKDKKLANKYMNVVLSQLLEFYDVAPIYRTCRNAMLGDTSAQSSMRNLIDILGEDCGGRNPLPDDPLGRDEWDPREEPLDRDLEDNFRCIDDLLNGLPRAEIQEYSINSLTPNNGCSGEIAVISGIGFSNVAGKVRFKGPTISSSVSVDPISWTNRRIEVAIPDAATYGPISLEFPLRTGRPFCGRTTSIFPQNVSSQTTDFIGGRPRIDSISFTKNNVPFDPMTETVLPGDTISLSYENSPNATQHSVDIREAQIRLDTGQLTPSVSIQQFPVPSGPSRSNHQLGAMNYNRSTQITCNIDLTNHCGITNGTAYFIVHRPATISLTGIEVTQAIQFFRADEHINLPSEQRPDISVPLIAGKRTLARVYYTTDQIASFNEEESFGKSFGLSVILRGFIDGVQLDNSPLSPFNLNNLFASADNSVSQQRGKLDSSANFLLPDNWIIPTRRNIPTDGELDEIVNTPLRLVAELGIRQSEPWIRDRIDISKDQLILNGLNFNRARILECVLVRYSIDTPNDGNFAAPSEAECVTALTQISEAYPTHDVIIKRPSNESDQVVRLDADLTDSSGDGCGTGWGAIMDDLGNKAFFTLGDDDMVWVGIVNQNTPFSSFGGCGGGFRAAFPSNAHSTGMQEIGHAFGLDHPSQDEDDPQDGDQTFPDYRGDGNASIGEFGVAVGDINPNSQIDLNSLVFDPDIVLDFMTRLRPAPFFPFPLNGHWVSPHTYLGLINNFFSGSASSSNISSEFAVASSENFKRKQLIIRGIINLNTDEVILEPPHHQETINRNRRGKVSSYIVTLSNEYGRVLYESPIITDDNKKDNFTFYHYAPFTNDCKYLEIKKGEISLLKNVRKEKSPQLSNLKIISRKNNRTINWDVEAFGEAYWCGVELTCDDGKNWVRLNELKTIKSFSFDSSNYGGGEKCRLRVFVTDGFNTSYKETESFSLPVKPPQIVPINFNGETEFTAGLSYELKAQPIYILGVAHQTELIWYLDEKNIGKGKKISISFEAGKHTIKVVPENYEDAAIAIPIIVKNPSSSDMKL